MEIDYVDYFNKIYPRWNKDLNGLIKILVHDDNADALIYLLKEANNLNIKLAPSEKHKIIDNYSYQIGFQNKVNLLHAGLTLNYMFIVIGTIEGNHFNMFLYAYEKFSQDEENDMTEFLMTAIKSGNVDVLKYFVETGDLIIDYDDILEDIIANAAISNRTNILNYLVEMGIVDLDSLRTYASINYDKNILNFINSYTMLGKRKRTEETTLGTEPKRYKY